MKKIKLFTALLAACLTLTLLPVGALAVDIYIDSPAPEHIWLIPGPGQRFSIVPPFSPANKDNGAEVTWADLSNLVWFGFFLNDEFELPYTDVPKDSWFYPGVCYVYARSLMDGVSEDTFAPHQTVTRALAWTVLASMNGADTRPAPGELWYERGMNWVMKYQVSDGSNPLDPITREQWVSTLWRRAGYPEADVDLSAYSDCAQVSGYAQGAMGWAISIGIIQGSNGQLSPQQPLTRAELASMVLRIVPKTR